MSNKINWKNIDLNLLVIFSYLYRYQNVSLAAEKYHICHSAMSHSLARLRLLFNDELFERKSHKMLPTSYANQIAPKIETLLASFENDLLIKKKFEAKRFEGICKIGLTDYAEYIFAPILYEAILTSAPLAQLSFINVDRHNYADVSEREDLDLLVGSITSPKSSYSSLFLYKEEHVCLGRKSLLTDGMRLSEKEFSTMDQAMVSPDGKLTTKVDKYLEERTLKRRVTVASPNFLTIRRLVELKDLIAIVPKRMATVSGLGDQLVAITPPIPVDDFDIFMLWNTNKSKDEKNIWLRELIKNSIK